MLCIYYMHAELTRHQTNDTHLTNRYAEMVFNIFVDSMYLKEFSII